MSGRIICMCLLSLFSFCFCGHVFFLFCQIKFVSIDLGVCHLVQDVENVFHLCELLTAS